MQDIFREDYVEKKRCFLIYMNGTFIYLVQHISLNYYNLLNIVLCVFNKKKERRSSSLANKKTTKEL